jgi:hypothetical protein
VPVAAAQLGLELADAFGGSLMDWMEERISRINRGIANGHEYWLVARFEDDRSLRRRIFDLVFSQRHLGRSATGGEFPHLFSEAIQAVCNGTLSLRLG